MKLLLLCIIAVICEHISGIGGYEDTCMDEDIEADVLAISLLQRNSRVLMGVVETKSSTPELEANVFQNAAANQSLRHLNHRFDVPLSRLEQKLALLVPFAKAMAPIRTNSTSGSSTVEVPIGVIFVKSMTAVAQAVSMAIIGLIAAQCGLLNANARKVLASISMNITIPCLLFSNILACPQSGPTQTAELCPDLAMSLLSAWPFLLFPILWVASGIACGMLAATIGRVPPGLRRTTWAACAFGNSTGLPIVLFTAISQAGIVNGGLSGIAQERQLFLLLSVYQITYPPLQWCIGTILLKTPQQGGDCSAAKKQHLQDETAISERFVELIKVTFTPPVIAVILGVVVGVVKPLRNQLVDYHDFDGDRPLQWGFNAVASFGQAAVPVNMMILGAALANTPSFSSIHWPSTISTAFSKLVLCPAIAFAVVYMMVVNGLVERLVPDRALHGPFVLVACFMAATPTANNLMVMAEMHAGADSKQAISSSIFVMYCVAPFTITAWIVAFCELGQWV